MKNSSLDLLTSVLERIPHMIFLKDSKTLKFVYVNNATVTLTGFHKSDLLGKNDFDFFPLEQAEFFTKKDQEVLRTQKTLDIPEEIIATRSGETRYLHTKKVSIQLDDGTQYLLGISEDITDRKKLEEENSQMHAKMKMAIEGQTQAIKHTSNQLEKEMGKTRLMMKTLEANENQLRLIANALPMRVAYVDLNHTYTFVNSCYEKWFGKLVTEIIGYSVEVIVGPEFYKQVESLIAQAIAGKNIDFEINVKDQTGGAKDLHVTYLPDFSSAKQVQGFVEITRDITEKKRNDEEKAKLLAREHAAQEASDLKSEFLANMSHEIRTPINGVLGMINLLQDTSLTPEQREYAENVRRSASSLLSIVNDILDFSKVEAGKLELDCIPFDLVSTFQDLGKIFSYSTKAKGLALVQELDSRIPPYVKGDPGRLRQVVTNLVGNAIKFTARGQITLRLKVLQENDANVTLRCEVQDTGIGVPVEAQKTLFKAFSQGGIKTSRQYGGTGLGLSISKRLLDLMQGDIGVKTEEGVGSTFWFQLELPKVTSFQVGDVSPTEIDPNLAKNFRVLVAEDNSINQKIIVTTLEKMGFRVDAVNDGKKALQALKEVPYDFILMDCQMPEMDGYEATRAIRNSGHFPSQIPIIAMTANAMKGDSEKCLAAGMNDYVAKPISKIRLANILNIWMNRIQDTRLKLTQKQTRKKASDAPSI